MYRICTVTPARPRYIASARTTHKTLLSTALLLLRACLEAITWRLLSHSLAMAVSAGCTILVFSRRSTIWWHIRLNLPTLLSRHWFLDALFLISVFKSEISCSFMFDKFKLLRGTTQSYWRRSPVSWISYGSRVKYTYILVVKSLN
jgi:hypothetical protein